MSAKIRLFSEKKNWDFASNHLSSYFRRKKDKVYLVNYLSPPSQGSG